MVYDIWNDYENDSVESAYIYDPETKQWVKETVTTKKNDSYGGYSSSYGYGGSYGGYYSSYLSRFKTALKDIADLQFLRLEAKNLTNPLHNGFKYITSSNYDYTIILPKSDEVIQPFSVLLMENKLSSLSDTEIKLLISSVSGVIAHPQYADITKTFIEEGEDILALLTTPPSWLTSTTIDFVSIVKKIKELSKYTGNSEDENILKFMIDKTKKLPFMPVTKELIETQKQIFDEILNYIIDNSSDFSDDFLDETKKLLEVTISQFDEWLENDVSTTVNKLFSLLLYTIMQNNETFYNISLKTYTDKLRRRKNIILDTVANIYEKPLKGDVIPNTLEVMERLLHKFSSSEELQKALQEVENFDLEKIKMKILEEQQNHKNVSMENIQQESKEKEDAPGSCSGSEKKESGGHGFSDSHTDKLNEKMNEDQVATWSKINGEGTPEAKEYLIEEAIYDSYQQYDEAGIWLQEAKPYIEKFKKFLQGTKKKGAATSSPQKHLHLKNIISSMWDKNVNFYRKPTKKKVKQKNFNLILDLSGSMVGKHHISSIKLTYIFNELAKQKLIKGNLICSTPAGAVTFKFGSIATDFIKRLYCGFGSEGLKRTYEDTIHLLPNSLNICSTDGQLTDGKINLYMLKTKNIEVYGVYTGSERYKESLKPYFTKYFVRPTFNELADEMVVRIAQDLK